VAGGALVAILGLAVLVGSLSSSTSMYPDSVHSLSAVDLQELRELHAAQFGTLQQERDALLEEGAKDEHSWVTPSRTHPHCSGDRSWISETEDNNPRDATRA
jgi:hypothetical protein